MFYSINYWLVESQRNACGSVCGSAALMGEKNTVHLLKKFQMTVCQYTICTAADCSNLQNRRLMWNWATSFLPGPQIDWPLFSRGDFFSDTPLWNLQMPSCHYRSRWYIFVRKDFYLETVGEDVISKSEHQCLKTVQCENHLKLKVPNCIRCALFTCWSAIWLQALTVITLD